MKTISIILMSIALLFIYSCQSWKTIARLEVVSMTKTKFEPGYKFKELGPVKAEFCFSEDKSTWLTYNKRESDIGLVDEVIMRAQKSSGADVILQASIEASDNQCTRIEGIAAK